MDARKMLQTVLPGEGVYCLWASKNGRPLKHYFSSSIDKIVAAALKLDRNGFDVYFAIAAFGTPGSRKADNVRALRCIAIDIDCGPGKPYPTAEDGLRALIRVVKRLALPLPTIVGSGGGIHAYWAFDEELTKDEWSPVARSLRTALVDEGLAIDAKITTNAAAVLRVPGTHNYKRSTPRPVKLLRVASRIPLQEMLGKLPDAPEPVKRTLSPLAAALMGGNDNLPPPSATDVMLACKQVKWAATHQNEVREPFWYNLLGVAAFTKTPEKAAIAWSKRYDNYSEAETLAKLGQWSKAVSGPPTCATLEAERPGGCEGCPWRGVVNTPIMAGRRYAVAKPDPQPTPKGAQSQATTPAPMALPTPFVRKNGVIQLPPEKPGEQPVTVCDFEVIPISYGYDEALKYEVARYYWRRKHEGLTPLTIRSAYLSEFALKDFATSCADQGIVLGNRAAWAGFQMLLRKYLLALQSKMPSAPAKGRMGWVDEHDRIAIGDTLIARRGNKIETVKVDLSHSAKLSAEFYHTGGSASRWVEVVEQLAEQGCYPQLFSLGLGFASPLLKFTGLSGITVSLFGPSGTGKTMAQLLQQSIWGNPTKLHLQNRFTLNAMFSRLALYGNLPATVDEITQIDAKELVEYLYTVTQGRDRARLRSDATEREARTWCLIATVSSNVALSSKLPDTHATTEAVLARLLEVEVKPTPLWSSSPEFGRAIYHGVTSNYGHAGQAYARRLVALGQERLNELVNKATERFPSIYGEQFSGVERYWETALVLTDLGLRLAKQSKLISFEIEPVVHWALNYVKACRRAATAIRKAADEVIADFLFEHVDQTVFATYSVNKRRPTLTNAVVPNRGIAARIDVYIAHDGTRYGTAIIEVQALKRWLSKRGQHIDQLLKELKAMPAMFDGEITKRSLGRGTTIRTPAVGSIAVALRGHALSAALDAAPSQQDPKVPQLRPSSP